MNFERDLKKKKEGKKINNTILSRVHNEKNIQNKFFCSFYLDHLFFLKVLVVEYLDLELNLNLVLKLRLELKFGCRIESL